MGIDFGTTGCRAIIIDKQKHVICSDRISYQIKQTPQNSDQHIQDPLLWWNSFLLVINKLAQQVDLACIERLSLDATSGTILLVNKQGKPISEALMYNDNRAQLESDEIQKIVPNNAAVHSSSSGIAKMLWLKRHYQPAATDKFLHQADWLIGQLTTNYNITDYNNALKSGMEITSKQWPSWIETLGIQHQQLAVITKPGTTIGIINSSLAKQLGFSKYLQIVSGCTDSTAAVIATGAKSIGDAITSLGSSLVVKIISNKAISDSQFGIYSQPYENKYLVGGSSNSGGAVLKHFFSTKQMSKMSKLIDIKKSTNLNYYPLLKNGERFPVNDPHYPAKLSPRPEHDTEFFQALLEGITEIEYLCYQRLQQLGCPTVTKIYSMGGGSQNNSWTQMRQSRLQVPIHIPINTEAAYGAALLAFTQN